MRFIHLLAIFSVFCATSFAQDWEVDPTDFEFSMTITGKLFYNGEFSENTDDLTAAFTNSECRGVAELSYQAGEYFVFLIIYSNIYSGETLNLKTFDAANQQEISCVNNLEFVANTNIGIASNPYIISDNSFNHQIQLTNKFLVENADSGQFIGKFSTIQLNIEEIFSFEILNINGETEHSMFQIINDSLCANQTFNYEELNQYFIETRANGSYGTIIDSVLLIEITDINEAPANLSLSNNTIDENQVAGSFIGNFSVEDEDINDQHTYVLIGDGIIENYFEINGNILKAIQSLDYETDSLYTLEVEVLDNEGLSLKESFNIKVNNLNESSINEDKAQYKIDIFPNPSDGNFTLASEGINGIADIEIYDIQGVVIYSDCLMSNDLACNIDLAKVLKGVCFLKISNPDLMITKKIVIK